jgi:chitodextrinase
MSQPKQDNELNNEVTQTSTETNINREIGPTVDHSRWMTVIWQSILNLRIQNLVLPSTHNAGADLKKLWHIDGLLAACQDDTFSYQLAHGARVFDLRIKDASYHSPLGLVNPVIVENMTFEHMINTRRKLSDCVETLRVFATNNPKEIIILSIESYKTGFVKDSIQRGQRYLAPLNSRLIPPSAKNMTLKELSENHPGKNIIIATPANIRTGNHWPPIKNMWAGTDSSLAHLTNYTNEVFSKIKNGTIGVFGDLWMFQAHARNANGPMRLPRDDAHLPYFRNFFNPALKRGIFANIVNVDFIRDTGLVDFCINTNMERGRQYPLPDAPSRLSAAQVDLTEQVQLDWIAPTNVPIQYYEIHANGVITITPHTSPGILESVMPGRHTYKVRAVDALGRTSAFSPEVVLHVEDIAPPSTPADLGLASIGMTSVTLEWKPSHDVSGIKRYEVTRDGNFLGYTTNLFYSVTNLDRATEYVFSVRAEDNMELYSRWASITLERRPGAPIDPDFSVMDFGHAPNHVGLLEWKEAYSSSLDYDFQIYHYPYTFYIGKDEQCTIVVTENVFAPVDVRARLKGTNELSPAMTLNVSGDITPPHKLAHLSAQAINSTSVRLTWPPVHLAHGYMILVNDETPVYAPGSPYTVTNLEANKNTFEVWGVNSNNIPGESAKILFPDIDDVPPTRPGTPVFSNIAHTSATATWTPSTDNLKVTGYRILLDDRVISNNHPDNHYTFTGLREATTYRVEIAARDAAGNVSQPASSSFYTRELLPGPYIGNHDFIPPDGAWVNWTPRQSGVTEYSVMWGQYQKDVITQYAVINNLQPGTYYEFSVQAKFPDGTKSAKSTWPFWTPPAI